MRIRLIEAAAMAAFLLLLSPAPAWAYIDPGMGSYLFQLTIAGGLAAVYAVRRYSHLIKTFVRARFARGNSETDATRSRDGLE